MSRHTYGEIKKIGKSGNKITIGNFCSIAGNVQWISVGHNPGWISTYPFSSKEFSGLWNAQGITGHPKEYGDLVIGNDVWIGQNVTFVGKITVPDGCIIGAGSVLFHYEYDPYSIILGNPARERKTRFDQIQISQLLKIKWWDWPDEKIKFNVHLLCSNRIDEFIEKHGE